MSFDWTTETLSHFIGLFEIADERARMRDDYDRFKRDQARDEETKFETMGAVKVKAPFKLDKFTPQVKYKPVIKGEVSASPFTPYPIPVEIYPVWTSVALPFLNGLNLEVWGGQELDFLAAQNIQMSLEPAGSVAVFSHQQASFIDNDVIVGAGTVEFISTDAFTMATNFYTYLAHNMQSIDLHGLSNNGQSAVDKAQSLKSAIANAKDTGPLGNAPEGATVSLHTGEAASGIHINGETSEEIPDLAAMLPQRLKVTDNAATDDAEAEAEGVALTEGTATTGEPIKGVETDAPAQTTSAPKKAPQKHEVPDGHNVVMGGNSLINEANIGNSWLDAPVMAVAGDAYAVNAVNQVNVVSDHDTGLPQTVEKDTEAVNFSQINQIANPFVPLIPGMGALPTHWVVAQLDADVINTNWVEQFTFALDNDIAEISFSGQDSFLQLGDNSVANITNISEYGYGYDLIFIGGSLINLNAVSQTNVLFDDDFISSTGDTPGTVTSSGNLLANFANITTVGADSFSLAAEDMSGASDGIEAGYGKIHDAFAELEAFNGIELLRVLHITGNLIQMNLVKQTNILGDADQVHVALDNFLGEVGDVSVNTGENALVNIANIGSYGVDSDVHVSGDYYSDAMLVQAAFIDTDADPLGVSLSSGDLATEAVAFLADDMISPSEFENGYDPAIVPTMSEDTAGTPDSLQVMLA